MFIKNENKSNPHKSQDLLVQTIEASALSPKIGVCFMIMNDDYEPTVTLAVGRWNFAGIVILFPSENNKIAIIFYGKNHHRHEVLKSYNLPSDDLCGGILRILKKIHHA